MSLIAEQFIKKNENSSWANTMATPIKETPVLYGKEARAFEKRVRNAPKCSKEEVARYKAAYENTRVFNSWDEYERFLAGQART